MIVTDWAAAREAIVEQRGERLAADIEALLRERELLAEASPCTVHREESQARIKELEAENERLRASALPDVVPEDVDALEAEVARLSAEAEVRIKKQEALLAECVKTRGELGERMLAAEARLEAVVAVAKALSDFSWSAVEPDCHASGEYLNSLLRNLRDVLDAEGKP